MKSLGGWDITGMKAWWVEVYLQGPVVFSGYICPEITFNVQESDKEHSPLN